MADATQEKDGKLLLTKQRKEAKQGGDLLTCGTVEFVMPLYTADYATHSSFPEVLRQQDTKANPQISINSQSPLSQCFYFVGSTR